ncbi:MAG: DUF362 domain-containing protein [Chitinivibrionales bacterium]
MVSRRDFLKRSALLGAAGSLSTTLGAAAKGNSDVVICTGDDIAKTVRKAIDASGGIKSYVKEGDRVVLKPNMSFANPPDWSTTTHPEVVKEVAKLCSEAGARRIIIVDNPLRDAQMCREKNGINDAVKDIPGAVVAMMDKEKFYKEVDVPEGRSLKRAAVLKEVLKADTLIGIPTAKSHSAAGVSLSLKNLMGLVWNRHTFHSDMDLHQGIADIATLVKPDLTVVDAVHALLTHGPGGPGKVVSPGKIVVSADQVAADSCAVELAKWYDKSFTGNQVKHIKLAGEMGVGNASKENINLKEIQS